jgi:uncharacterized phage protein gp47/JayE
MLGDISNDYDKTVGSFIYDATKPAAIEMEKIYQGMDDVIDKMTIDNLTGDELTQRVKERTGVDRKPATKANDNVTVTGSVGTVINIGDKVASDTVNFSFVESKTIGAGGTVSVKVECDQDGAIGNVPANAIKYFPVTLPGLTAVTNPNPFTNGFDAESDEELLDRYYERMQTPATSGNKAHYKNWAKEVVGVGDAKVIPLWNGDNTVKVVIIDSNKQPANASVVNSVQTYIDPGVTGLGDGVAPIGAKCTVVSAAGLTVNVSFTATKDPVYTDSQRQANVEASIRDYLKSIAFVESQVSYAKVGAAILNSQGILDYSNLTINGGTININIGTEQVPVLGGVTIV